MADWADYPITLRVQHLAEIFSVKVATIYDRIECDDPEIPRPDLEHPYRWSKAKVKRHLETVSISGLRRQRMQRAS